MAQNKSNDEISRIQAPIPQSISPTANDDLNDGISDHGPHIHSDHGGGASATVRAPAESASSPEGAELMSPRMDNGLVGGMGLTQHKDMKIHDSLEVSSGIVARGVANIEQISIKENVEVLKSAADGLALAQAFDKQLHDGHAEGEAEIEEREGNGISSTQAECPKTRWQSGHKRQHIMHPDH